MVWTARDPSRSRPPRKPSSTTASNATTSAPARSSRSQVATAVPPVARMSSTTRTRGPGDERVGVHLDGGGAVLQLVVDVQRLPRAACRPCAPARSRCPARRPRRAEDEAAGLDADDHVDAARAAGGDVPDHGAQGGAVASSGVKSLNDTPGLGEVGDVAQPAGDQLRDRLGRLGLLTSSAGAAYRLDLGGRRGWLRGPDWA